MNKKTKSTLATIGTILFGVIALTSCSSFCSDTDEAYFRYAYDPINTRFFETKENAEDYITSTFVENNDLDVSLTINDLKIYKGDDSKKTLQNVEDSDLYGDYGNLVYLKPNRLYYEVSSTNDEGESETTTYTTYIGLNDFTKDLITTASASSIYVPSFTYFEQMDLKLMDKMLENVSSYSWLKDITKDNITYADIYGYAYSDYLDYMSEPTDEKLEALLGEDDGKGNPTRTSAPYGRHFSLLTTLGYLKFSVSEEGYDNWEQIERWDKELSETLNEDEVMTKNYLSLYKSTLNSEVSQIKTCITINDGFYGHTSDNLLDDKVRIEGKASNFWQGWGESFSHGFLEGLLVYPISYMVESFSHAFGMNGWGQIWAVLLVTLIVRLLFMAITLPSTLSQQKMQLLQPEIEKLQQKYPNYDTDQYEKQRFAQAQAALYKKYKVRPALLFLTLIIQMPLFICVWNAMRGSASLSSDAVLGLRLSDTIWNTLTNFSGWPGNAGWWTALVLIILMSAAQIVAVILPNILSKKRSKKVQKTVVSPSKNSQQKSGKIFQWVMTIMIIVMGFTLPSAMGVYWLAGAIFGIIQTLIMHVYISKKMKLNK